MKNSIAGMAMYSTVMVKRAEPKSQDVNPERIRRIEVWDGARGIFRRSL